MAFQSTRFIRNSGYPKLPCALTAHFHPYHSLRSGGYFLQHFLYSGKTGSPFVKWCGALHCPDFPHFRNGPAKTKPR